MAGRKPKNDKTELGRLRDAVNRLGHNAIDLRTSLGKALVEWRREMERDLGGAANLSAQQHALLDQAVRQKLMLDSIDAWILARETLVTLNDKGMYVIEPVVKERQALADGLARYLAQLGMTRVASSEGGGGLAEYLQGKDEGA